jgi:hypothetical protein
VGAGAAVPIRASTSTFFGRQPKCIEPESTLEVGPEALEYDAMRGRDTIRAVPSTECAEAAGTYPPVPEKSIRWKCGGRHKTAAKLSYLRLALNPCD